MSNFESQIRWSKSQRIGILCLVLGVLLIYAFSFWILPSLIPKPTFSYAFVEQAEDAKFPKNEFKAFNPDTLSHLGWQRLGFSRKQAASILRYKVSLGGHFPSKDALKKAYVISPSKWEELEEHVQISKASALKATKPSTFKEASNRTSKATYSAFNPNLLSQADWTKYGFTRRQAQSILRYKASLGGRFSSPDELAKCYVISEEKFHEIKPYLRFDSRDIRQLTQNSERNKKALRLPKEKFNPSLLQKTEWQSIGFTSRQAQTIINYKNSLGGTFPNWEVFSRCYAFSKEQKKELKEKTIFPKDKNPTSQDSPIQRAYPQPGENLNINEVEAKHIIPFLAKKRVAKTFINYRRSLGGFKSKRQILKVYGIQPNEVDSLLKYYPLKQ